MLQYEPAGGDFFPDIERHNGDAFRYQLIGEGVLFKGAIAGKRRSSQKLSPIEHIQFLP
jgi:hypothetical protein